MDTKQQVTKLGRVAHTCDSGNSRDPCVAGVLALQGTAIPHECLTTASSRDHTEALALDPDSTQATCLPASLLLFAQPTIERTSSTSFAARSRCDGSVGQSSICLEAAAMT